LNQIKEIIDLYPDIALESIGHLIKTASTERIKQVVNLLNQKLEESPSTVSNNSPSINPKKLASNSTNGLPGINEATPPSPFHKDNETAPATTNGTTSSTPKSNRK
jgi:hypothetical protein